MNQRTLLALTVILFLSRAAGAHASPYIGYQMDQQQSWPEKYSSSYGFEIMRDHDGRLIVWSVDSTSQAFRLGVRPDMELIGWNTIPVGQVLASMKVRKFRKQFPTMSDEQIRMTLLTRGKPGETAEAFFMTASGNNRGIRVRVENRQENMEGDR